MGFNKFTIWDLLRIIAVLVIIAIVYFGFIEDIDWQFSNRVDNPTTEYRSPEPSSTLIPSSQPTSTLLPTFSEEPEPSSTPELDSQLLDGQTLLFWNEFDQTDPVRGDWYLFPNVKIEDGLASIESTANWDGIYGDLHLEDGQAILVKFRFYEDSDFYITFETGEWLTDSYRAWGIGSEDGVIAPVISDGNLEYTGEFSGFSELLPDHWYVVMLYIGGSKPYNIKIWDFAEKIVLLEYTSQMDDRWVGLIWSSTMIVGSGFLEIDRYEEIDNPFN